MLCRTGVTCQEHLEDSLWSHVIIEFPCVLSLATIKGPPINSRWLTIFLPVLMSSDFPVLHFREVPSPLTIPKPLKVTVVQNSGTPVAQTGGFRSTAVEEVGEARGRKEAVDILWEFLNAPLSISAPVRE